MVAVIIIIMVAVIIGVLIFITVVTVIDIHSCGQIGNRLTKIVIIRVEIISAGVITEGGVVVYRIIVGIVVIIDIIIIVNKFKTISISKASVKKIPYNLYGHINYRGFMGFFSRFYVFSL